MLTTTTTTTPAMNMPKHHVAVKLQFITAGPRLFSIVTKLTRNNIDFEQGFGIAVLEYGAAVYSDSTATPVFTKNIRRRLATTARGRLEKCAVVKTVVWCREDKQHNENAKLFCAKIFATKLIDASKLLILGGKKTKLILRNFIGRFGVSAKTRGVISTEIITEKLIAYEQ
jgi:hypothetical protein